MKGNHMSKLMTKSRAGRAGNWAAVVVAAVMLAFVAGCGGGGGGADPTQQTVQSPAEPMAKILSTGCTASAGESSCNAPITVTSANVSKPTLAVNVSTGTSVTVAANTTASTNVTVPVGTVTLQTDYGGTSPAVASVTVSCATGLVLDSSTGKCAASTPKLSGEYFYAIYALGGLAQLDLATGKPVFVENKTGYGVYGTDWFNLAEGRPALADGTKLFVAYSVTKVPMYAYLGNDGALYAYTGTVPDTTKWFTVDNTGANYPTWYTQATRADGTTCYDGGGNMWDVQCQDSTGKPISTIVNPGAHDGLSVPGSVSVIFVVKF